ncbi:HAD family hydrolase [Curvivirga aplysinae]|uniref:HAD family hydrolase n=1 Tax=Curvivirga aplysinae TaxID=2529852 RepID=UPI0012BC9376|nr:HAD-IA family hydrolase [Curvivirga aplysinae]MTI10061.1 HAD family hydrolase [Curvivirga aplysinae]
MIRRIEKLKHPKAIVFDWDNTLVNTWPVIHKSLEETYLAFDKKPMTMDEVKSNVKYSLRDSFPDIFHDEWEKARDIFYDTFEKVHLEELQKLEGADIFLNDLKSLDIPISLVSNKTGKYLRQEAKHLEWDELFHRMIGAGDAENDKPAIDPLYLALEETNLELNEAIWFVGDSEVDIKIAENAGCTGILLHFNEVPTDMAACPHQVHPDFDSLIREIRQFY